MKTSNNVFLTNKTVWYWMKTLIGPQRIQERYASGSNPISKKYIVAHIKTLLFYNDTLVLHKKSNKSVIIPMPWSGLLIILKFAGICYQNKSATIIYL